MPTTSPAGSRNVLRQPEAAPLLAPSTSVPWSSRMSISSSRWAFLVQLVVGRGRVRLLPARTQQWLSWGCEDVEQGHRPLLTLWCWALGRLQTALCRFSGSVLYPGDFTYPGNSSVGLPLHDNRAVVRWLGWGWRLLKVKCLMGFDFK